MAPWRADFAAGINAWRRVGLTRVVATSTPSTRATERPLNFRPLRVTVVSGDPVAAKVGSLLMRTGVPGTT